MQAVWINVVDVVVSDSGSFLKVRSTRLADGLDAGTEQRVKNVC